MFWRFQDLFGGSQLSGTGASQRDSRESFAIENPACRVRQADSPESLEFPIRANHPIRANRANRFARMTPLGFAIRAVSFKGGFGRCSPVPKFPPKSLSPAVLGRRKLCFSLAPKKPERGHMCQNHPVLCPLDRNGPLSMSSPPQPSKRSR